MKLYHIKVCWPRKVRKNLPFGQRAIAYTKHALRQARKRGIHNLPKAVHMRDVEVFEGGINENGTLCHIAFRLPLTEGVDMVMAAALEGGAMVVKTCWTNQQEDKHKTLDKNKYVR